MGSNSYQSNNLILATPQSFGVVVDNCTFPDPSSVWSFFGFCGKIINVDCNTGQHRQCIVYFDNQSSARRALFLDQSLINNCVLRVRLLQNPLQLQQPQQQQMQPQQQLQRSNSISNNNNNNNFSPPPVPVAPHRAPQPQLQHQQQQQFQPQNSNNTCGKGRYCVFVTGASENGEMDGKVQRLFTVCGTIKSLKHHSHGIVLEFESAEATKIALLLNNSIIDSLVIKVAKMDACL